MKSIVFRAILLLAFKKVEIASVSEFTIIPFVRATFNASSPFQTIPGINQGACAGWCAYSQHCTMANFNKYEKSCELYSAKGFIWSTSSDFVVLVKIEMLAADSAVSAEYQAVSGMFISGVEEESFANYNVSKTRSVNHCQKLCESLRFKCSVFAYLSTSRLCHIPNVDFYLDWTTSSAADARWTSYYKINNGSWKLLLKVSKGIGVDILSIFTNPGNFNTTGGTTSQMARDNSCACYIKNQLLDYWTSFPFRQIKLELASNGQRVAYVNFEASSLTKATFFQKSAISNSSWTDLTSNSVISTIQFGDFYGQYLTIEKNSDSCGSDISWMSVNWRTPGWCPYDKTPAPQFAYSAGLTADLSTKASYADALLIYGEV